MDIVGLKEAIKKKGYTQAEVAKHIGMSVGNFRRKIKEGTIGLVDAEMLIKLLDLEDPGKIFFGNK